MPLTKNHIVFKIYEKLISSGHDLEKCLEIVETLIEIMKRTLEEHEDISIDGFGKFIVKFNKSREAFNFITKEKMVIPDKYRVKFKYYKNLYNKVNDSNKDLGGGRDACG